MTERVTAPAAFAALHDIVSAGDEPAIYADRGVAKEPLSYSALKDFIAALDLRRFGIGRTDTLCTAMPNGPEAAVCFLAFTSQCVFAPLNPALTTTEIEFELHDLPAHTMVVMETANLAETRARELVVQCCERNGVPVLTLVPDLHVAGLFTLRGKTVPVPPTAAPTVPGDLALVLHTSGTTKKPKIVPLTHSNLAHGIQYVADTLRRSRHDVCLNVMPLFHIHGLVANVGVTLLSRGAVVCSSFQGGQHFVDRLGEGTDAPTAGPTPSWYSAVPTMHEAILLEAEARGTALRHSLSLMRNCSAALLPPVSKRFLAAFGTALNQPFTVLPTYAMTESFPICSNPCHPAHGAISNSNNDNDNDSSSSSSSSSVAEVRLHTVGPALGPRLCILHAHPDDSEVAPGEEGEVCVSGTCVTAGYFMREHMAENPNLEAFSREEAAVGRMLRTGDKGFLDADGYLQLVGRFKEIINCAGEKVSPLALEDVLLSVRGVQTCVCFAAPAEMLGEVVGVAVVAVPGVPPPTLPELQAALRVDFSPRWRPQLLVLVAAIPKGPTGKPKRIGLAQMLGLPMIAERAQPTYSTVAGGGGLTPRLPATACDARGDALWPAAVRITLLLDADLPEEEQSRHTLNLGALGSELELELPAGDRPELQLAAGDMVTAGDATLPAEIAEGAEMAEVAAPTLTVTNYTAAGDPISRELPISREEASEALAYVRRRADEFGRSWVSLPAAPPAMAHDFCGWLEVSTADGSETLLRHEWRADCVDTPPGKLLRLLKTLPLPGLEQS